MEGLMTLRGPDVSSYQGHVDWAAVKASGRPFGFSKATEATNYINPTFGQNRQDMAAVGLTLRGFYHFPHAGVNTPEAEAAFFLRVVGHVGPGEISVLDIETNPARLSSAALGAWALRFLQIVEQAQAKTPMIYSYLPFLQGMDTSKIAPHYPLWIAGYSATKPRTDRWPRETFWQYTSSATVPGISGRSDDSIFFSDNIADLAALAGGAGPPPTPSPGAVPMDSFMAYAAGFAGGVNVAIAKRADGSQILVTGPRAGGGPDVEVWREANGVRTRLCGFFAYDPSFLGGVSVAVADLDGDGNLEIVTGPGPGGGPNVKVFRLNADNSVGYIGGFFAFDASFAGGVDVEASLGEIFVGPGPGGGPNVKVFDYPKVLTG